MKKPEIRQLIGLAILTIVISILGGCSVRDRNINISIAALNGPTGIGLIQLMDDKKSNYDVALYQSPDEIVGKIISGEVDLAAIPSNLASVLYNKTEGQIKLVATNTLGVLYVVENGTAITAIEDLRGKTILATGKGSAPLFILSHLLQAHGIDPEKDVKIEYLASHSDVASVLAENEGSIALLPQPFVTVVQNKSEQIHMALDLNEIWYNTEQTELPMGVIVGQKEFVEGNKKAFNKFLKDYKTSVDFVNNQLEESAELVVEHGILPHVAIAIKAIPECHIVYRSSEASKESLTGFYTILKNFEPKAIGGSVPDEGFYISD